MKSLAWVSSLLLLCSCADEGESSAETDDGSSSGSSSTTQDASASVSGSGGSSSSTTDASTTTETTQGATTGPPPGGTVGCGEDPSAVATTVTAANLERTFILRLPSNYDPETPTPLVFAFHGLGGSAAGAQGYFGIDAEIGDGAIIVYPDALPLDTFGGQTGWELGDGSRDVLFFDEMVRVLTEGLCVDPDRIFSTGHSFGGFISNSLGCFRGDVLRAIAPVAGGGPFGSCTGNVAAWLTHGEADDVVEFAQGTGSRDHWLGENSCGDATQPASPSPCEAYDGCGEPVVWCPHLGGHEWPAFAPEGIWAFFSSF